jgi:hypothetical protein
VTLHQLVWTPFAAGKGLPTPTVEQKFDRSLIAQVPPSLQSFGTPPPHSCSPLICPTQKDESTIGSWARAKRTILKRADPRIAEYIILIEWMR